MNNPTENKTNFYSEKGKVPFPKCKYIMAVDIYTPGDYRFHLIREVKGVSEIILRDTSKDKESFDKQVSNLVKYFNAAKYSTFEKNK